MPPTARQDAYPRPLDSRASGNADLRVNGRAYRFYRVTGHSERLAALPRTLRILAENVLRCAPQHREKFQMWLDGGGRADVEIEFQPARVLMHDTTCVPALVDLATLRDAVAGRGGDPSAVNPVIPVDLVIDHSIMVDRHGSADALAINLRREFERNGERYAFIRWAEKNVSNFRVVPPGHGIVHQINLEHLSEVVREGTGDATGVLLPDTVIGTDSHTPMVNGLGVLGWGVGGIEGISAALGQPLVFRLPEVVGVRLTGRLAPGVMATDLALTLTQLLRDRGVVDKYVEFFGLGVGALSVADRATIANMAPEYGATCAFFPIDGRTIEYLRMLGRAPEKLALVESYAREQGLWHDADAHTVFTDTIEVNLEKVSATVAGPKRPQDALRLEDVPASFCAILPELSGGRTTPATTFVEGHGEKITDGAVLIAAITSCTNTSNPALMIAAGLLARNARAAGLRVPSWVKTSLSPGSRVVTDYLRAAGLLEDLEALGFFVAGYGCMTCIGNSGLIDAKIAALTATRAVVGAAVLSGNRNFQGRINPAIDAAYLASPPLVVAYALAGSVLVDFARDPIGRDGAGKPVHLARLWPTDAAIAGEIVRVVKPEFFSARGGEMFSGSAEWQQITGKESVRFAWNERSTYLRLQPYFREPAVAGLTARGIRDARVLAVFGDHVTTDHISPAGAIPVDSLAGRYLAAHGLPVADFNQYSTRRGNHEVMVRGAFSHPRLTNKIAGSIQGGGVTRFSSGAVMPIYEAAQHYARTHTPLVVVAGCDYGAGSSRDWAAKGPSLLGVCAVVAVSFERIHRSNLVGMGILPLQFIDERDYTALALDGTESIDVLGFGSAIRVRQELQLVIRHERREQRHVAVQLRAETELETEYLRSRGVLHHILKKFLPDVLPVSRTQPVNP